LKEKAALESKRLADEAEAVRQAEIKRVALEKADLEAKRLADLE